MTAQTCETCRFCSIKRGPYYANGKDDTFTCHRYPPSKMRGFTFGVRFDIERTEWCGEWAAKPQQPED